MTDTFWNLEFSVSGLPWPHMGAGSMPSRWSRARHSSPGTPSRGSSCYLTPVSSDVRKRKFLRLRPRLFGKSVIEDFTTERSVEKRGIAKPICLSVCPSVTLRYRGHIGWNSRKIFSRRINLTFPLSLSADPNITDLLKRELPKF